MGLALITFAYPALWVAAGAVAAPVLIHLILRSRPRRVVFPAMRFVKISHQANLSWLRLRHLVLLAMRMLAVLGLVALLAGPRSQADAPVLLPGEPMAVVIAIDNSGSMGYRFDGRTHLAHGKAQARQFVQHLPAGSRVAVLAASDPAGRAALSPDMGLALRQIEQVPQTPASLSVGPLVRRAARLLAEADLPRKSILLVTDRTAQAFAADTDTDADLRAAYPVLLLDCWRGDNINIALDEPRLRQQVVSAGMETPLDLAVRCVQPAGQVLVRLMLGETLADQASVRLDRPGQAAGVGFLLRPQTTGLLEGQVELGLHDPLALDNVRYFTLAVRPPRELLVVRDAATVGRADPASFLMANAAAPGGLAGGHAIDRRMVTSHDVAREGPPPAATVLLANVSGLDDAQWGVLDRYVRQGGSVWVVPGDLASSASWNSPAARALLGLRTGRAETLASPASLAPGPYGPGMLAPFDDPQNAPLTDVRIHRRLPAEHLDEGVQVELTYADGTPAIVSRPLGRGRVVWWGFSPDPAWSDLAGREQLPILARRTALVLLGAQERPLNYRVGQEVRLEAPPGHAGGMAWVRPPTGAEFSVPIDPADGAIRIVTDRVGHWRVHLPDMHADEAMGFAVNAPARESDLTLLAEDDLRRLFGERLSIAGSAHELLQTQARGPAHRDLRLPLVLVLLVLLISESFLANRFYRRATVPTAVRA